MAGSDSPSLTQNLLHGIPPQSHPEPRAPGPDGQEGAGGAGDHVGSQGGMPRPWDARQRGPKEPRERALTWPQEAMSKIAGLHGETTRPGARRPPGSSIARLATEVTAISGLAWW